MSNEFGFFPSFYEDELVYSILARYHVKSGNTQYKETFLELFGEVPPNIETEFFCPLTEEAEKILTRNISLKKIVLKHTMFGQSARFLEAEKREEAFRSILFFRGGNGGLANLHKKKEEMYFRYCPLCVGEDRKTYGETYWHRQHQLRYIDICAKHNCRLHISSVPIRKGNAFKVCAAEFEANCKEEQFCSNEIEMELAKYVLALFELPMSLADTVSVTQFLQHKIEYTKYMSDTGINRKLGLLTSDFMEFYKELPKDKLCISKESQMLELFLGERGDLYSIALLGLFLGVEPIEFANMKIPEKTQAQIFKEEVERLHNQGIGYSKIALELNTDIYSVRQVLGKRRKNLYKSRERKNTKGKDWRKLDRELLPRVEEMVSILYGEHGERPKRISFGTVQRLLGLTENIFQHLPICRSVIRAKIETQVNYHAREIVWAFHEVENSEHKLTWRQLQIRTNIRKNDFIACLPYIENDSIREQLESLL